MTFRVKGVHVPRSFLCEEKNLVLSFCLTLMDVLGDIVKRLRLSGGAPSYYFLPQKHGKTKDLISFDLYSGLY